MKDKYPAQKSRHHARDDGLVAKREKNARLTWNGQPGKLLFVFMVSRLGRGIEDDLVARATNAPMVIQRLDDIEHEHQA